MGEIKITRKLLDNYRKLKREIPVLSMELAEMKQGEAGLGSHLYLLIALLLFYLKPCFPSSIVHTSEKNTFVSNSIRS